jgi:hypothetical protein
MIYLRDSEGKKSLTATCFFLGFIVITIKYFLEGMTLGSFVFRHMDGVDYGIALTALGGIYVARKVTINQSSNHKVEYSEKRTAD